MDYKRSVVLKGRCPQQAMPSAGRPCLRQAGSVPFILQNQYYIMSVRKYIADKLLRLPAPGLQQQLTEIEQKIKRLQAAQEELDQTMTELFIYKAKKAMEEKAGI
jgi:hypothetical protein